MFVNGITVANEGTLFRVRGDERPSPISSDTCSTGSRDLWLSSVDLGICRARQELGTLVKDNAPCLNAVMFAQRQPQPNKTVVEEHERKHSNQIGLGKYRGETRNQTSKARRTDFNSPISKIVRKVAIDQTMVNITSYQSNPDLGKAKISDIRSAEVGRLVSFLL
jgi:hypothetical protein